MNAFLKASTRILLLVAIVTATPWPLRAATPLSEIRFAPDITAALGSNQLIVPGGTLASETNGVVALLPISPYPARAKVNAYSENDGAALLVFDGITDLSSFTASPPLVVEPRDVVQLQAGQYSLVFDGSTNGIPAGVTIDAVTRAPDGDLVLSFDTTVTLAGTTFADEDLVRFDGSARAVEFRGADHGIARGLDLDAASTLNDSGDLLLSFDGSGSAGGVAFNDEDVLEFDRDAGTFELAYDGSAAPHAWPVGANLIAALGIAPTPTPSSTLTSTPTLTPSPLPTDTLTATSIPTMTPTETVPAPASATPIQTATGTLPPTQTSTVPPSQTPTESQLPTSSPTATETATRVPSETAVPTATGTAIATATQTPSLSPAAATPSHSPSSTATVATPTLVASATVSASATASASASATPSASATASVPFTPTPTGTVITVCPGDCDGDNMVTVDEIITLVNIALGTTDVGTCLAGDTDNNGIITVDEIITALNRALLGC